MWKIGVCYISVAKKKNNLIALKMGDDYSEDDEYYNDEYDDCDEYGEEYGEEFDNDAEVVDVSG